MFSLALKTYLKCTNQIIRHYGQSSGFGSLKVAVCGAAGKSGQAVSLLLKACPLIDELSLYDVVSTGGIALELNHIDTKCHVYSYKRDIKTALKDSQIVAIVASAPKITGPEGNFKYNADIVCDLVTACAEHCPRAFLVIGTNPVNSMVPVASEVMKHYGCYNPNHIFGVTGLDVMRTNSLVAQKLGVEPETVHVPCIGGFANASAVPVLNQTKPKTEFTDDELLKITEAVQSGATRKQDEKCETYLSCALAVAQFVISLVRGIKGEANVVETCYVRSKAYPNMEYLATPIVLGTDGISKNLGVPEMTDYEKCLFQTCREALKEDIIQGEEYVKIKFGQMCPA